jgi:hypothetical protein
MAGLVAAGARPSTAGPETVPYDLLGTEDNPNLYQRLGQSELACLAEVIEDAHYATLRAVEIFAGRLDGERFEIVYRGLSWGRRVEGEGRIRFTRGDRFLLFLRYYREHGRPVRPDLFELIDADWSRLPMSGESERLYVDAMRLLIGAAARPTLPERQAVLLGLLGSPNQVAAGAAMSLVAEAGLGGVDDIPLLLAQMDRGIAGLKLGALRILRKLGPTLPPSLDRGSVADAIQRRVAWRGRDPLETRLEAVRTLMALGAAARPQVEEVARTDADQAVRYEAAVWLVESRE